MVSDQIYIIPGLLLWRLFCCESNGCVILYLCLTSW